MDAIAILYAMKSPCDHGWRRLSCEFDSQVVIHLLNQKNFEVVSWKLALIANQTHNLCTSLEPITFTHIPREWNSVVDCLAKWASDHVHKWNIVDKINFLCVCPINCIICWILIGLFDALSLLSIAFILV